MGIATKKSSLFAEANKLLSKSGFSWDGQPKGQNRSKKQMFFERKVIIMTPMGNGSR